MCQVFLRGRRKDQRGCKYQVLFHFRKFVVSAHLDQGNTKSKASSLCKDLNFPLSLPSSEFSNRSVPAVSSWWDSFCTFRQVLFFWFTRFWGGVNTSLWPRVKALTWHLSCEPWVLEHWTFRAGRRLRSHWDLNTWAKALGWQEWPGYG